MLFTSSIQPFTCFYEFCINANENNSAHHRIFYAFLHITHMKIKTHYGPTMYIHPSICPHVPSLHHRSDLNQIWRDSFLGSAYLHHWFNTAELTRSTPALVYLFFAHQVTFCWWKRCMPPLNLEVIQEVLQTKCMVHYFADEPAKITFRIISALMAAHNIFTIKM